MLNEKKIEQNLIKPWYSIVIHNYVINILVIIILSAGLSGIGAMLSDVANIDNLQRYLDSPLLFALNTIPLTLFMLLLYHLTSRHWVSFSLGGGLYLALHIVNRLKMQLREEPLTLPDFMLGTEAAKVVKFSELPISNLIILSCIFWAIMSVFLFVFIKSDKLRWPVKVAGITAAIALFTVSYMSVYKDNKLYDSFEVQGSIYSRVNQFKSRGFLYSFLVRANNYKDIKPEGYSKAEAEKILDGYKKQPDTVNDGKMPHIIAVMGEAFYDIDRIKGIQFNEGYDPLANFNRISRQGYKGRIVTNIFGGGTANTEFAFLTGHSMPIMPEMDSPYSSYLRKDTFSLTRVLEKKGYSTLAFHPGDPWFYNRKNVYDFFGFDNIFFKNAMDLNKVKLNYGYISDRDTADFILGKFRTHLSEKPGVPFFNFTVNIDNHGPYSKEDLGNPEILKRQDTMDDAAYYTLNNYINGVMRCDQALGYLVDSINEMDEPVVFLYFADHLPFLGENNLGYKALNFDASQSGSLEAFLNQYETPYFIFSNSAARKLLSDKGVPPLTGTAPTISSNYLATELLEYTGLDGGAYYNFLSEFKKTMPVITNRFYEENGTFTENLSNEGKKLLDRYRQLQYYMLMEKEAVAP